MQSQIEVDKEDLYMSKINCNGKKRVEKANKGINVEKIIVDLKIKIRKRERGGIKKKTPQNCRSPAQRQRFITTTTTTTKMCVREKKAPKLDWISQCQ